MSEELREWLEQLRAELCRLEDEPDVEASLVERGLWASQNVPALIDKCEELAGALELLASAARGVPHNGDNLVMGALETATEEAESAARWRS